MLKAAILAALIMLAGPLAVAAPFDDLYVRYEAQASGYEVAFARTGQARATRADVRAYAAMLVNDHEAYGTALRELAASKGIAVPSGLAASDRARLDRLSRTRGAAFDRAFVREARRINGDEARAFRREAGRVADPAIRTFVERFLDMDARHEAAAKALGERAVASAAPVIRPPPTGDTMATAPPPSYSAMPMIAPPQGAGR
jgi:putative membrane protein